MVRGKFKVQQVTHTEYGSNVVLLPEYDPSLPEDVKFSEATPSGKIELYLGKGFAEVLLQPGAYFYVDFNEVGIPDPPH